MLLVYHAIDADGTLVDSTVSETLDMEAAKRFFTRALMVVGRAKEGNDGRTRRLPARHSRDAI